MYFQEEVVKNKFYFVSPKAIAFQLYRESGK